MSKLDPELCMYLKSARASTRDALAALGLAHIRIGVNVAYHPTDEDKDVLVGIRETISDLRSAMGDLDFYIDGHAGEVER